MIPTAIKSVEQIAKWWNDPYLLNKIYDKTKKWIFPEQIEKQPMQKIPRNLEPLQPQSGSEYMKQQEGMMKNNEDAILQVLNKINENTKSSKQPAIIQSEIDHSLDPLTNYGNRNGFDNMGR